jgi:uncharacterized protein (TIGR03382 family)
MYVCRTIFSVVLLAALGLAPGVAHAMGCQGIDAKGHCPDLSTVEWCDEGVLRTASCPEGEICTLHVDYEGYTCIAKSLTACADVPDEGMCQDNVTAAWCSAGEVEVKECGPQEVCEFVDDKGWVDCVPETATPPGDVGDEATDSAQGEVGGSDFEDDVELGPQDALNGELAGPTPNVQQGEPWGGSSPGGCQSGGSAPVPLAVGAIVLLLGLIRRRT